MPITLPQLFNTLSIIQEIVLFSMQTPLQYVTSNESSAIEFSHGSSDHAEIFLPVEGATVNSSVNGNGLVFKRRPSDTLGDQHNVVTDWNDYIYPPAKRLHSHTALMNSSHLFSSQPSLFEYQGSAGNQSEAGFGVLLDKVISFKVLDNV